MHLCCRLPHGRRRLPYTETSYFNAQATVASLTGGVASRIPVPWTRSPLGVASLTGGVASRDGGRQDMPPFFCRLPYKGLKAPSPMFPVASLTGGVASRSGKRRNFRRCTSPPSREASPPSIFHRAFAGNGLVASLTGGVASLGRGKRKRTTVYVASLTGGVD